VGAGGWGGAVGLTGATAPAVLIGKSVTMEPSRTTRALRRKEESAGSASVTLPEVVLKS
jgi:hypothetical protein